MKAPMILGGITVRIESGAPEMDYDSPGGFSDATLSNGMTVRMRHYKKELVTVTGSGWFGSGLDGLDMDQYHLLLCNKPKRMNVTGLNALLTSDPRPDVPVRAVALVDGLEYPTPVAMDGRAATITPVAGAQEYTVIWYPQFLVLCTPPPAANSNRAVSWTLICREI